MDKSTEIRRRPRGARKLLLPALCLVAGTPAMAGGASPYELVVQAESNQGKRLVRGYYDRAEAVDAKASTYSFEVLNNRCVMNIVNGSLAEAAAACNGAVDRIDLDRLGARYQRHPVDYRPLAEERKAMALINRGVLRALTSDVEGARDDFERAVALGPHIGAGPKNLARLEATAAGTPELASLSK